MVFVAVICTLSAVAGVQLFIHAASGRLPSGRKLGCIDSQATGMKSLAQRSKLAARSRGASSKVKEAFHVILGRVANLLYRVGDRVGVGAQSSSCLKPECEECASGMENHCANMVGTYDGKYGDGSKSYGGYSDYCRAPSHFVLKIPDTIPSEEAAPMLCGGITVFAPLKKNGCGPGKKVGIVGVGGLGHFGILYAKVK